jgi:large subunit ribosomal protein L21
MTVVLTFGSKQYSLEDGQQFIVDRVMEKEEGDVYEVPVIYAYGTHDDGLTTISVTVVKHQRGEKIRVTKYRPKSNYHRQYGPRQEETVLKVGGVAVKKAKIAVKKAEVEEVKEKKPSVKAKATTVKPVAKVKKAVTKTKK